MNEKILYWWFWKKKNHIQTTSNEWAVHHRHPWCSGTFVVRLQPIERLTCHMSEEIRLQGEQTITDWGEKKGQTKNPREANWQLCIVHTATREKSWRLKLSPHEHHVRVTKSQLSREKIKSECEGKTVAAKLSVRAVGGQRKSVGCWFFLLSFLRNTEDQTWFKVHVHLKEKKRNIQ